jgi:transposase
VLYLAGLVAGRARGSLQVFARRLEANGESTSVALVAVAQRLLVIANAVARDGRVWQAKWAAAP